MNANLEKGRFMNANLKNRSIFMNANKKKNPIHVCELKK